MLHSIDNRGLITEVSDMWLTKLGYTWDEVIGRSSTSFLSEQSARYAREIVLPAFFRTGTCEVEYEMVRKDGTLVPVRLHGVAVRSESGAFVRSIAVIEDLTERRALERKVFEIQKLESLGLMAGNIAHDFNNLLTSVVGSAELALRHARGVPAVASELDNILIAASRAAELCRQLLAYSGRGRFHVEVVDLNDIVGEMVQVLDVTVGKSAKLALDLMREGARVEVDATQIRQIVMNLVLNAAESFGDMPGTIAIRTAACELDQAAIAATTHPDIKPGRYFCLEVRDDGVGMGADVLARLFDPFFTTKATGRGLGLAAVHGIVRGHHGTLKVSSEVGRGTEFQIYLPVAGAARRPTPAPAYEPAMAGRGTIMIVDDDELLRNTLARQLDEAGFRVVLASGAAQALALLGTVEIATYVLDVTMPGTSGPELALEITRRLPGSDIVLMSGFDRVDLRGTTRARFLQKPFTEEELLRALDQGAGLRNH